MHWNNPHWPEAHFKNAHWPDFITDPPPPPPPEEEELSSKGWIPDRYVKKRKSKQAILKLERLEELRGNRPQKLKVENLPSKITKDLSKVKVRNEAVQLIDDLRKRLLALNKDELEREQMAIVEHEQMLKAWQQVQDEMLILFMFTEGEA